MENKVFFSNLVIPFKQESRAGDSYCHHPQCLQVGDAEKVKAATSRKKIKGIKKGSGWLLVSKPLQSPRRSSLIRAMAMAAALGRRSGGMTTA